MDHNTFKDTSERISNAHFCGISLNDVYSCVTLSGNHDELDAAIEATIALNDLVDAHYAGGIEDAMADCYIYTQLGALDDDLIRDIAYENGVDVEEIYERLDKLADDFKPKGEYDDE